MRRPPNSAISTPMGFIADAGGTVRDVAPAESRASAVTVTAANPGPRARKGW